MEKKTLSVTGEAQLSFTPDTIAVLLGYHKTSLTYKEALDGINQATADLKRQVSTAGLHESDVKTRGYRISPSHKSEKDAHGNYHNVYQGFEARASFEASFPFNNETLNSVIQAIANSNKEIRFEYRMSNMEGGNNTIRYDQIEKLYEADTLRKLKR